MGETAQAGWAPVRGCRRSAGDDGATHALERARGDRPRGSVRDGCRSAQERAAARALRLLAMLGRTIRLALAALLAAGLSTASAEDLLQIYRDAVANDPT